MTLGSQEHYDILDQFESYARKEYGMRVDREANKSHWRMGVIYQSGDTNAAYKAFIAGYALAKGIYQSEAETGGNG